MEYCKRSVYFFLVSLCLIFSVSGAFRLDDIIHGRLKHIPLTRTRPNGRFGFLRGADFEQFDKELRQLYDHHLAHDRLRRSVDDAVRSHNRTIIDEFELKGDNHTVAFLHWAGKKSSVIYIYTCAQINQTQNHHTLCEDAYFWRSTDYGSTFKRVDNQFKAKSINNVDFCASNNKKVIVSSLKNKTLYISENEGEKFVPSFLNFAPHVISCNPLSDKLLAGHDTDAEKVYYSIDGGKRWLPLYEKVLRHFWGPDSNSELFLEVKTSKTYTSELRHVRLPCIAKDPTNCVTVFDKSLGNFMAHTFEVEGRYMFVQKDLPSKGLYVLYKNISNSAQNFFQHARFPLHSEEKEYKVVDASENETMVVVRHMDYYNLYVSDVTGVKFSLSLQNVLSNRTKIWGMMTTLVDIHRVRTLPGTYLANQLYTDRNGDKVKSVISFNKGGEWHPLKPPEYDHNGMRTNCYLPSCSLHIHIVLSRWYYYIPGVLSSSSAVGIIVAQGNLGERLGEWPIGVFMSNDGGLTWTKEFDNFYDFVIGDHGGILTAVSMWRNVQEVWYTCTEGKSWKNVSLDNRIRVYGMVTEPGETTLIVNLFGQYSEQAFQWLSVKLNFTSVLDQKCQADNYTHWSPNDERVDSRCLLGQHLIYERRKSGDCCFNGMEYEREVNISACICEVDDFDCDFGYQHPELDEVCLATSLANPIPSPCPEGKFYQHSRGYRKVVGDRCVGGVEDTLKPYNNPCPITAPKDLSIDFKAKSDSVEVNKQVYFNLSQEHGSTESTRYVWNFGDGRPVLNVTGLDNAKRVSHKFNKHGQFIVTVAATNSAGHFMVSTDVTVLDPIISVEIDPPHAVIIGKEAWFNVTLSSNNMDDTPQYGYVYYMWAYDEKNVHPVLTWDPEVSHVFRKAGKYDISVTANNFIGFAHAEATVTVYEDLTTIRLSFDAALDKLNENKKEWRSWLTKRLQALLYRLLNVAASRLEVVVLPGTPTQADVSITPAPTVDSKTRQEIVDLLREKVSEGVAEIHLPNDITVRITNFEVLPDRGGFGSSVSPTDEHGSGAKRLAIGIGISTSLVVIFLAVTLFYFLRRYHRLQSRYTHLRLYSDGGELRDRDPLIDDQIETEHEQTLHSQPGGTLRYIPLPTSTEPEPDSDEELIDNFQDGSLVVMPEGQNGQVQGENPNA